MKVLYIDTYALINLAVNYFLLLATGKLCGIAPKRRRMGLAAAIGAAYAVLAVLPPSVFPPSRVFESPVCFALSVPAVCFAAFGRSKRFLRLTLVFFLASCASGGLLYALDSVSHGRLFANLSFRLFILVFFLAFIAISVVFSRSAANSGRVSDLAFTYDGKSCVLRALRDSGNTLTDSATGLPCAVVPQSLLPEINIDGLRKIPYTTVAGQGEIPVFVPEWTLVDGKAARLAVAISPHELDDNGTYRALLPALFETISTDRRKPKCH
ncbi:MAG: sigma-E processing peptidase SpoIIGA [Oscillospiraceae bacterium]|jgi:stage II sporulation protein GA (sporulation sigma-E factor processing peptidase)|nr:sigma-E processing peptidase SpoIIGA [Oscillospiraceae bacterium]